MAEQKTWVGSVGPFIYDDTDQYNTETDNPDSPEDLELLQGIRTTGQILVESAGTDPNHVLRVGDILEVVEPGPSMPASDGDSVLYAHAEIARARATKVLIARSFS